MSTSHEGMNPIHALIAQCGGDQWGSVAQYPFSAWREEVDNGTTILGYWEFVLSSAERDGIRIEDLCSEEGRAGEIDAVARKNGWTPEETRHARESLDNDYGRECMVPLGNGRVLCSPGYPSPCYYIRVTHLGYELAYWSSHEFRDDPELVMGALMGVSKGPGAHEATNLAVVVGEIPEYSVSEGDGEPDVSYQGEVRTSVPGSSYPFRFNVPRSATQEDISDAAADAALAHITWSFSPADNKNAVQTGGG